MKPLKLYATLTVLMLVALTGWQYQLAQATPVTIEHITTLNQWGNDCTFIYRGQPAAINITFNSVVDIPVQIHVTLFDINNVPVAVTSTTTVLSGEELMPVDLFVESYAYIGSAYYRVVVTDQNSRLIIAFSIPVYIALMGDFDSDNKITSQDVITFMSAFNGFSQNQEIYSQYPMCDLNSDKKIDFIDLTLFATSYIDHNQ